MIKKQIRKTYALLRQELGDDRREELDEQLQTRFAGLPLNDPQILLSYHALAGRKEFDATQCERLLQSRNPGMVVAWPRLAADMLNMEAVAHNPGSEWVQNRYAIREPSGNTVIDPLLIDLVFVPLLAFDLKGYRVGYGKGYYDRYLARCRPSATRIGFSYFEALPSIGDIDEFDVPLNLCITPMGIYEF